MTSKTILLVLLMSILSCSPPNGAAPAEEKTSPFSRIDFKDESIYVTVDSKEYRWLSLDTIKVSTLVELFEENYRDKWQKRISEDLVEYLNKQDVYPKQQESFTLEDGEGNIETVKLTFDRNKRELAKDHFESTYEKEIDLVQVLSNREVIEDLDQLEGLIQSKYSYAFMNDINVSEEIQTLKESIEGDITTYDLALKIGKLINKFGDGHSRIRNVKFKKNGVLPFSVHSFNGKVICTKDGILLNNNHPFLHSVNGIDLSKLLEISEEYLTPDASPQFKERVTVSRLNRIGEILRIAGSTDKELRIKLESEDGKITSFIPEMEGDNTKKDLSPDQARKLLLAKKGKSPFEVKHFGKIGYLRISSMVALGHEDSPTLAISEFENSTGLIIDVRGDGGGLRDILVELAPHFINEQQGSVVGNVARLRTNNTAKDHDLSDRYLYQINDVHFDEATKLQLNSWSSNFSTSTVLEDSLYSSYYFLRVEGHDNAKFSSTPTVVLMDAGCYSATDIFLSTFKEIDGVTLIGTPSGGGSGRSRTYQLNNSLIEVNLSSIVSFQPSGELYDGIGVHPDIEVRRSGIADLLKQTDSQLEFALKFLEGNIE